MSRAPKSACDMRARWLVYLNVALLLNNMGLPEDILRGDTGLAFVVAIGLSAFVYNSIMKALVFAVLFVVVFLVLKHILIG